MEPRQSSPEKSTIVTRQENAGLGIQHGKETRTCRISGINNKHVTNTNQQNQQMNTNNHIRLQRDQSTRLQHA